FVVLLRLVNFGVYSTFLPIILARDLCFFFLAEVGIRGGHVTEFRRVLFRSPGAVRPVDWVWLGVIVAGAVRRPRRGRAGERGGWYGRGGGRGRKLWWVGAADVTKKRK